MALEDDLQGFARLWEILTEDSQGFVRIWETGIGFLRICGTFGTLGVDFQGFARHWEALREDLLGFTRLGQFWERICEDLQEFGETLVEDS